MDLQKENDQMADDIDADREPYAVTLRPSQWVMLRAATIYVALNLNEDHPDLPKLAELHDSIKSDDSKPFDVMLADAKVVKAMRDLIEELEQITRGRL